MRRYPGSGCNVDLSDNVLFIGIFHRSHRGVIHPSCFSEARLKLLPSIWITGIQNLGRGVCVTAFSLCRSTKIMSYYSYKLWRHHLFFSLCWQLMLLGLEVPGSIPGMLAKRAIISQAGRMLKYMII